MSDDILARLQAASSDEEREWLVLEMSLNNLEPAVRDAVWAAAVPHWFDEPFLAALLDDGALDPSGFMQTQFAGLTGLSFIEPFPGRGHNVHERTRELLLARLWRDDRARYRELNHRAAQDQNETHWRVETIYHQLSADESEAVDTFKNQGIDWYNSFEYEKLEVLTRPILTEVENGRFGGVIAGWAYDLQAGVDLRYSRNHEAKAKLLQALDLELDDQHLQADCLKDLGDVERMLAEYEAARGRYEAALPIYQATGWGKPIRS